MLVTTRKSDEGGSALVSVLVMMLVVTLLALTLATLVANTSNTLAGGRYTAQARAAADAGIAAALAAFTQAKACGTTITSASAPVYEATCSADAGTVTFTSTGHANNGLQVSVQSVYGYTIAHSFDNRVGQLTFFDGVSLPSANTVASSTSDLAKVTVVGGDFSCYTTIAANLLVGGRFSAYGGCSVSGSVTTNGDTNLYGSSSIGGDLTSGGTTYVNGAVAGNVNSSGYLYVDYSGNVAGSATAASTQPSYIYGKVGQDVAVNGTITISYNASVAGNVTAAGSSQTSIYGSIGKNLSAIGPVRIDYNAVVTGDVIAAGRGRTYVYGRIGGYLQAGGAVTLDYNGSVGKYLRAAGTDSTDIHSRVGGDLVAAGTIMIDYGCTVSGDVTSSNAGRSYLYGKVTGNLTVAGVVTIDYNGSVGATLATSATGTDYIYGKVLKDLAAGGDVYLDPAGSVAGNLTLPTGRRLTPADASTRVLGTVTNKNAPSAPAAPTVALKSSDIAVTAKSNPPQPTWQDYDYAAAEWPGYTVQALPRRNSWCTARNWATNLATYTAPTVLDATACDGGLSQHPSSPITVTIKTDVVIVSTEIDLQGVTFKAASGTSPHLWFIVPSAGREVLKNAGSSAGNGGIYLSSTNLGVATMLYTPKVIYYYTSTFTGSMYAGDFRSDSGSPGRIIAAPMEFPLALFDSAQTSTSPSAGVFTITRVSQREVR